MHKINSGVFMLNFLNPHLYINLVLAIVNSVVLCFVALCTKLPSAWVIVISVLIGMAILIGLKQQKAII